MGISGKVAKTFLTSEITPLLGLVGLMLGLFAIAITPREEEPQINVTFANVLIPFPGASSREVEEIVSTPAEQVFSELKGVKHVYSVSRPGMAVISVRFKVGEDRNDAIVRLYDAVLSNRDWLPAGIGIGEILGFQQNALHQPGVVTLCRQCDTQIDKTAVGIVTRNYGILFCGHDLSCTPCNVTLGVTE